MDLTQQAAHILREGDDGRIMVNGHGVFTDHRKRLDELWIARNAIDKAIALIDAVPWPNNTDYKQLRKVI